MIAAPARSVDELIYWISVAVTSDSLCEWHHGFAKSILRQSKRRGWNPTPKQERVMREIVDDLLTPAPALIEDGLEG